MVYEIKIGCQLRRLNAYLIQYGKENTESLDMTSAQSMLLEYLLYQKEEEYRLTDICMELGLAKATVSVMLKNLRNRGYLEMEVDPEDDRRKRIILTEKAFQTQREIEERLKQRAECIFQGITEQELEVIENALDKMITNLRTHTEEEEKHDKNTVRAGKTI